MRASAALRGLLTRRPRSCSHVFPLLTRLPAAHTLFPLLTRLLHVLASGVFAAAPSASPFPCRIGKVGDAASARAARARARSKPHEVERATSRRSGAPRSARRFGPPAHALRRRSPQGVARGAARGTAAAVLRRVLARGCAECLARRLPFESGTPWEHHAAVLSGDRPAVSAICWSEGLEEEDAKTSLRSLMEAPWSRDAAARPPMLRFVEVLESVEGGRVIAPVEQEDASALLSGVPRSAARTRLVSTRCNSARSSPEAHMGRVSGRAWGAAVPGRRRSRSRLSRPPRVASASRRVARSAHRALARDDGGREGAPSRAKHRGGAERLPEGARPHVHAAPPLRRHAARGVPHPPAPLHRARVCRARWTRHDSVQRKQGEGQRDLGRSLLLRMAVSIGKGLAFLHSSDPPVIHRDLKPANCFVFSDPAIVKVGCVALLLLAPFLLHGGYISLSAARLCPTSSHLASLTPPSSPPRVATLVSAVSRTPRRP